jgi:glycosyltransferase involved in cell wall biosynthesis
MRYKPFFSIVTPTYNRGKIIENAIKSVLNQNFQNWELIIVDDGSTDNTTQVIKKYLSDKRIKYIKLSRNYGVNYARNKAIQLAKGKFLLPLDSDNHLLEGALEEIYKEITQINHDLLFFRIKTASGKLIYTPTEGFIEARKYICEKVKGEFFPVCKVTILKRHPFLEDINGGEGITWKKIAKKLEKIYFSPKQVLLYNDLSKDRLSGRNCNYNRAYKIYLKELQVFGKYYFLHCPILLFKKLIRHLLLYKFLSILTKNKSIKDIICNTIKRNEK